MRACGHLEVLSRWPRWKAQASDFPSNPALCTLSPALAGRVLHPEKTLLHSPRTRGANPLLPAALAASVPPACLCPLPLTLSASSFAQVDPGQRVKQGATGRCSSMATSSNGARIASPRRHAAFSPSMPTLADLRLPPAHAPPHACLRPSQDRALARSGLKRSSWRLVTIRLRGERTAWSFLGMEARGARPIPVRLYSAFVICLTCVHC